MGICPDCWPPMVPRFNKDNWVLVWQPTICIIIWMALSVYLNLFNKWLFQEAGFKFPVFLTQFHMIANFVGALFLMSCMGHVTFNWEGYKLHSNKMILLSILFVFKITTNNTSLLTISLTINQMLKSTLPFLMCVLSVVFEGKRFGNKIWLSCVLVITGTCLTVYKNPEWDPYGFSWAVLSLFGAAAYILVSAQVLSEPGFHPTNVLAVVAGAGSVILPCWFVFLTEKDEPLEYFAERPVETVVYVSLSSVMTLAMNLVHFKLIKVTSSVTTAVVGNLKTLLVFILSMMHLEKGVGVINVCGVGIGMMGLALYSEGKIREKAEQISAAQEKQRLIEEQGKAEAKA